MLKKTITYTNYNGETITEDLYFNLNKVELMEMELSNSNGLSQYLQELVDNKDIKAMLGVFKELILKSYGIKSEDGKRFVKNAQIREEFEQSEAFSELFMELATNPESATAFANGIVPQVDNKAIPVK